MQKKTSQSEASRAKQTNESAKRDLPTNSPDAAEQSGGLDRSAVFADSESMSDNVSSDGESSSWLSPEMRPTLWRGLAVVVFILFGSLVIPLFRPAPVEPPEGNSTDQPNLAVPPEKKFEKQTESQDNEPKTPPFKSNPTR